jgi:hypothetical protein
MNPYVNIAYARLNLDFDHRLFALEFDKLISPHSKSINNNKQSWERTRKLNQTWGMVDPETYDKCTVEVDYKQIEMRGIPQWKMTQLMYLETNDSDSEMLKREAAFGGTYARNLTLHRDWKIKPQFEKLKLVKFIKTLPFKSMNSIHCVSLKPGSFASIHRDSRWFEGSDVPNVAGKNGVFKQGFVIITLNISDGGVPLYWALDDKYVNDAYHANDPVYMCSDYFLHGVPVCTGQRRQIRITGIPTDDLANLIDQDSKIMVPPDMEYAVGDQWYPG